jgi:DNA recombination protein RmuC
VNVAEVLFGVVAIASLCALVIVFARVRGTGSPRASAEAMDRIATILREDLASVREELAGGARAARQEQREAFAALGQGMMRELREAREQTVERLDRFALDSQQRLGETQRSTMAAIGQMSEQHRAVLDDNRLRILELTQVTEQRLERLRQTVEGRLVSLQEDNAKRLEQMRATVDEKLHESLERRLGESFRQVSERLEQVHKGLGEMQTLAAGVGDLKRVLVNVKTRGTLGEIQLDGLLEQVLSPEQYQRNVSVRPSSAERVDFAIVLPGKDADARSVLLPVDAKFPLEDYQRLVDAQAAGDAPAAAEAGKMLERRVRAQARTIQEKYISPPYTTDFALMFLPIEGLFAEVLRRPGLWETLQRDYRVVVTGPTTITALLNSLQMGFRSLAIERRSSEVWKLLGTVKQEFGKFGGVLEKTQKKLQEASNTIEDAARRSRAIERQLIGVQELPQTPERPGAQEQGEVQAEAPDFSPMVTGNVGVGADDQSRSPLR